MFEIKVIDPSVDDDEKDIDAELDLQRVAAVGGRLLKSRQRLKAELDA